MPTLVYCNSRVLWCAYVFTGRPQEAVEECIAAVHVQHTDVLSLHVGGRASHALGQFKDAVKWCVHHTMQRRYYECKCK